MARVTTRGVVCVPIVNNAIHIASLLNNMTEAVALNSNPKYLSYILPTFGPKILMNFLLVVARRIS